MKMKKKEIFGDGIDSVKSWEEMANAYAARLQNPYHRHRLGVIDALIPKSLYAKGQVIFDFGCGDGVLFYPFIEKGAKVMGCDPAREMIDLARKNLAEKGLDSSGIHLGGVNVLADLADSSCDAMLSFNVLAYLTDKEEAEFYTQVRRIVKPGGWLVVTHSNNLFDLFTANRMTVDFMTKYLVTDPAAAGRISTLFSHPDEPKDLPVYNIRENPLAYPSKLKRHGFDVTRTEFVNRHAAPPLLRSQDQYPDTLSVPEEDRWKLTFTCSTFGVCAQKAK